MTWVNQKLKLKAVKDKVKLYYDRFEEQQPQCSFGLSGVCCKNCFAGPCKIIPGKSEEGICGANADTIIARNFLRTVAAGTACHVDHAREIVMALHKIALGKTTAYKIKDEAKLRSLAKKLGKKSEGPILKVAERVALEALEDFRRQEGVFHKSEGDYLNWLKITATKENIKKWKELNILPVNADLETSRVLHQTTLGNDANPQTLMLSALRTSLADGYAGLQLTTNIQDVLFGTPTITKTYSNLGVIKENYINIAVHGHVPLLSEKIVEHSKKLLMEAKKAGAKGINVVGVCCTGNEVLMRLGIPAAGHILQSELAIVTGALEAMVVDTQCIYPSLQDVSECYHTKIITTMVARIPRAIHVPFHVENADEQARKIVLIAVKNYANRDKNKVLIPNKTSEVIGGVSFEALAGLLSNVNKKEPLKPLVDAIKKGDIYGVVALVGCRNPKLRGEKFGETIAKKLLEKNVLILATGCMAHSLAQEGLMSFKASKEFAGKKLDKVLTSIANKNHFDSLPPVLYIGSCVDNSRLETIINALSNYTKIPVSQLPVIASAPEYMAEKAVAIGTWALALGITTHLNPVPPVTGSKMIVNLLTKDLKKITGSKVLLGTTPDEAVKNILEEIKLKRKELGLKN
ncbi:MAG: anaerobic carbon-monoxide dehydrogenase catalytic subunit [archaeon]